jgi:hypothetical protein
MSLHRSLIALTACASLLVATVASSRPALGAGEEISGFVTDGITGAVMSDVCVTLGPPITCFTRTNAEGFYRIDLEALAVGSGQQWDMYFLKTGYQTAYSEKFVVSGPVRFNQVLMPTGQRELCPAERTGQPTQTAYLANVTKTLGGATGWQTPFIVQNTGTVGTILEVTYNRFLTGKCALRKTVTSLQPGTSFADVPNNLNDLAGDTQYSVVVKSFGATVVSVVNEHAGAGARAEALSYVGVNAGSTSAFLPNITRRFFGYVTPFIIQNLGSGPTTASARFVSFDGTAPTVTVTRDIPAGGSKFIDPNSESGLVDGKQYTVTVTAPGSITVVVNTHNDAATVAAPVAYSTNGITVGAETVYGPYAAKNAGTPEKRVTTIVVQNLSQTTITPSLQFDVLGATTGTSQTFASPTAIEPGRAWAFDPRFTLGTTTPCTTQSSTCLGEGEYSFVARSNTTGAQVALAVNVISATNAMGYMAIPTPTAKVYLPNVTRTLGGNDGWTTPILLQAIGTGATGATLRWYRFSDGALVHTQTVEIASGRGTRIDPRGVAQLADNTQYSVVIDGAGGTVAAIVMELASGGDNAMIYEGFPPAP